MQESVVSVRGQTVIPKELREQLGIESGTRIRWSVKDKTLVVRLVPTNPVDALRGVLKGKGSTEELLEERGAERDKEERKLEEELERWRSTR